MPVVRKLRNDISHKTISQQVAKETARIFEEGVGIRVNSMMNNNYRAYRFAIQIFRPQTKDVYFLYQFYGGDKMNVTNRGGVDLYWYNSHGYTTIEALRMAYPYLVMEKNMVRMVLELADRVSEGTRRRLTEEEKEERFELFKQIKAEHKRNRVEKVSPGVIKKDFIGGALTDDILRRAAMIVDQESYPSITYHRDKSGEVDDYQFFMKFRRRTTSDLDFLSEYFGFSYRFNGKDAYWMGLRHSDFWFLEKIRPFVETKKVVLDAIFEFFNLMGSSYRKSLIQDQIDHAFEAFRSDYGYETQRELYQREIKLSDLLGMDDGNDK